MVVTHESEGLYSFLEALGLADLTIIFTAVHREWNLPQELTFIDDTVYFVSATGRCVYQLPKGQLIVAGLHTVKPVSGMPYEPVRYIAIVSLSKGTAHVFFPKNQPRFDVWTMEQLYARRTLP